MSRASQPERAPSTTERIPSLPTSFCPPIASNELLLMEAAVAQRGNSSFLVRYSRQSKKFVMDAWNQAVAGDRISKEEVEACVSEINRSDLVNLQHPKATRYFCCMLTTFILMFVVLYATAIAGDKKQRENEQQGSPAKQDKSNTAFVFIWFFLMILLYFCVGSRVYFAVNSYRCKRRDEIIHVFNRCASPEVKVTLCCRDSIIFLELLREPVRSLPSAAPFNPNPLRSAQMANFALPKKQTAAGLELKDTLESKTLNPRHVDRDNEDKLNRTGDNL